MLMLLCVHVTRVLFLVLAGNFALNLASIGVTHSYSSRLFLCAHACSGVSPLHAGGVTHEGLYQTKSGGRDVLTHEVGRGVATR